MIDTGARSKFDPMFDRSGGWLLKQKVSPNQVTGAALTVGLSAAVVLFFGLPYPAVALLWFSGYLDAVDGSMARLSGKSNPFGAMLDIVSDRVVELSIFWALALNHPESYPAMMGLVSTIVLTMTVFLTTGMLLGKSGKKSFYYQPGLMERTEGFIASTAMMLFQQWLVPLTWIYAALIGITIIQRLLEARKLRHEISDYKIFR